MTGKSQISYKNGADGYLNKPFEVEMLNGTYPQLVEKPGIYQEKGIWMQGINPHSGRKHTISLDRRNIPDY